MRRASLEGQLKRVDVPPRCAHFGQCDARIQLATAVFSSPALRSTSKASRSLLEICSQKRARHLKTDGSNLSLLSNPPSFNDGSTTYNDSAVSRLQLDASTTPTARRAWLTPPAAGESPPSNGVGS